MWNAAVATIGEDEMRELRAAVASILHDVERSRARPAWSSR
jgi:hypothetical protein